LEPALAAIVFVAGALVSLTTSWVLVTRIERVGERLGFSEALLGIVAALAADAPELTAAITAVVHHEHQVGAGVVIGSNVFNLAALLGLGALVAGRIALHRRVIELSGAVAIWVAGVCVAAVVGAVSPVAALVLSLVAVALYVVVLAVGGSGGLEHVRLPRTWTAWLGAAVADEELELEAAIRPRRGTQEDALLAAASLVVVVVASVAMERAASTLGSRYGVPEIVIGGLVLAAVTSLPNAVAAVYLASRGRGAAVLSTALNSNAINVTVGLLLPAAVIGLGEPSGAATFVAASYLALTVVALVLAYLGRGLGRGAGAVIVGGYLAFVGVLLAVA
jgi:cation:H+ antiporter